MGLEKLLWTVIIEPAAVLFAVLLLLSVLLILVTAIVWPSLILYDFIYGELKKKWYREYYSICSENDNNRNKFLYNKLFREEIFPWK
jgi:hypothetical protein